jgi:hypothetical protein
MYFTLSSSLRFCYILNRGKDMTDEERQRQMDFIVNTLARLSVKVDALVDTQAQAELERKADAVRIGRVEDSLVTLTQLSETLTQLAQRFDERLEKHDERLNEHQAEIVDVKQAVVILTKLVSEGRNGQS